MGLFKNLRLNYGIRVYGIGFNDNVLDAVVIARHISGKDHNHREALFEIRGVEGMDELRLSYVNGLFRLIPAHGVSIGIRGNDRVTNPPKELLVPMHFVAPIKYSLTLNRYD